MLLSQSNKPQANDRNCLSIIYSLAVKKLSVRTSLRDCHSNGNWKERLWYQNDSAVQFVPVRRQFQGTNYACVFLLRTNTQYSLNVRARKSRFMRIHKRLVDLSKQLDPGILEKRLQISSQVVLQLLSHKYLCRLKFLL